MNVLVYKTTEEIASAAAAIFAAQVIGNPDSVLGLATGSTPVPTYKKLIELYESGVVDFSGVTTYNLDEYCGLERTHDQSYYDFMMQNLFGDINVPSENIHVLSGMAEDPEAECETYEASIEYDGGIDLQILGLGNNGHIAFNEPCAFFPARTHVVNLTESTIEANKRFFASADDVPRQAVTMGIGTIMKAYKILLIATGKNKAEAVKAMIQGEIDPMCPASILQLHGDVTVLLDEAAAGLL